MFRSLLYVTLGLCLLSACKKSEKKKLVGEWLLTAYAEDSNSNKLMDASEVRDVTPAPMMNTMYTFKSGAKAEIFSGCIGQNGSWKLEDDGKKLTIILPEGRALYYKVTTLDDKTLTIEQETADNMLYWQTFTKQ